LWNLRSAGLKSDARAQLHLAARRYGVGDGSELRCVHETIWRAEVHLVERVEEFAAYLNFMRSVTLNSRRILRGVMFGADRARR